MSAPRPPFKVKDLDLAEKVAAQNGRAGSSGV